MDIPAACCLLPGNNNNIAGVTYPCLVMGWLPVCVVLGLLFVCINQENMGGYTSPGAL